MAVLSECPSEPPPAVPPGQLPVATSTTSSRQPSHHAAIPTFDALDVQATNEEDTLGPLDKTKRDD